MRAKECDAGREGRVNKRKKGLNGGRQEGRERAKKEGKEKRRKGKSLAIFTLIWLLQLQRPGPPQGAFSLRREGSPPRLQVPRAQAKAGDLAPVGMESPIRHSLSPEGRNFPSQGRSQSQRPGLGTLLSAVQPPQLRQDKSGSFRWRCVEEPTPRCRRPRLPCPGSGLQDSDPM